MRCVSDHVIYVLLLSSVVAYTYRQAARLALLSARVFSRHVNSDQTFNKAGFRQVTQVIMRNIVYI